MKNVVLLLAFVITCNAVAQINPTYQNIAYGPHKSNVLDFWKAESAEPTPLVIFIHGGGFAGGDKSQVNFNIVKRCLDNKVSFASINYRLRQTTRLDTIMLDIARALQFLRYKSPEWNMNKDRIAAYGGSAGGAASLWLAVHDDLADPSNSDPVLRESTRLTVIGHLTSQATHDFRKWAGIIGISENWMEEMNFTEDLEMYHISNRSWYDSTEIAAVVQEMDMISKIDITDPPVYFSCMNPNEPPNAAVEVIHHPRHAIFLHNLYDSLGVDNAIVLADTPPNERIDMLDFFFRYLFQTTDVVNKEENPETFQLYQNYPNPFNPSTTIHFSLSHPDHVTLKVFDVLGREVATLVDGEMDTGEHIIIFNAKELPSGVYFYRLNTSEYSQTKSMELIK